MTSRSARARKSVTPVVIAQVIHHREAHPHPHPHHQGSPEKSVEPVGSFRSDETFGTVARMLPKVYIETTIVSYLTGRPSRDVVSLGHQQVTRDWWEKDRSDFELYTSEVVIAEAERGDPDAARARLAVLAPMRSLSATAESEAMVPILLRETRLPADALLDMSHVSIATVHGMQYLLTWNCRHIANARTVRVVERICRNLGFEPPVLCTPDELRGM